MKLPGKDKEPLAYLLIWISGIVGGLLFLLLFGVAISKLISGDY
ncbi:hypothetical protein [Chitinophaga sp.]|nr:hypothetical protein [Chitinophaga sp.]